MQEHKLKPSHVHLIQELRPFLNKKTINDVASIEIRKSLLRLLKDKEAVPYEKLIRGVVKELKVVRPRVAAEVAFLSDQGLLESTIGGLPGKGSVRLTELGKYDWRPNWETKPGPVLAELIRDI
jgi:hypothetical protein